MRRVRRWAASLPRRIRRYWTRLRTAPIGFRTTAEHYFALSHPRDSKLTREGAGHNVLRKDQIKIANLGEPHETKQTRSELFLAPRFHKGNSRRRRRGRLDRTWRGGSEGARAARALGQRGGRRGYRRGCHGVASGDSSDRRRGVRDSDRREHGCRRPRDLERRKHGSGWWDIQTEEIWGCRFTGPAVLGPDGLVGRGAQRVPRLQVQRQRSDPRFCRRECQDV